MLLASAKALVALGLGLALVVMGWEALDARPDALTNLTRASSMAGSLWEAIGAGYLAMLLLFVAVAATLGVARNIPAQVPSGRKPARGGGGYGIAVFVSALMAAAVAYLVEGADWPLGEHQTLTCIVSLLILAALVMAATSLDTAPGLVDAGLGLLGAGMAIILSGGWAQALDTAFASAPAILRLTAILGYGLAFPCVLAGAVIVPVGASAWRDWGPSRSPGRGRGQRIVKPNEAPRQ